MKIQNGQIYLEDVPVTLIAQTYGTPTYVYEENRIRDNFRRALNAFKKYYGMTPLAYRRKNLRS